MCFFSFQEIVFFEKSWGYKLITILSIRAETDPILAFEPIV